MSDKRDDIRRTTRIIQLDEMFRGGNYVKVDDILFKFGISMRTLQRDFQHLRDDMNAPLEYDKDTNSYHYTDPTFSIPNVVLTEGDLFTVSTVIPLMEQYKNTPLENNFRHIMSKITDMLPDKVTVDTSYLNKDITFIKEPLPEIQEEVFNTIFKSLKTHKTINFDYRGISKSLYTQRTFNPYHVLCQKANWYVLGYDHDKADIKIYALSRIKNISITSQIFKVPQDFDPQKYIDQDFGIWNNPEPPVEYELLFPATMKNYITERQWHQNQSITENKDGSLTLRFKSNQKQMIHSWVLGFGSSVKVLNPPELVDFVKEQIKNILKMYEN